MSEPTTEAPKKYIPPPLRRQLEAQARGEAPSYNYQGGARSALRGSGSGAAFRSSNFDNRGGGGGPGRFERSDRHVADRWKGLDSADCGPPRGGSGRGPRVSRTGTGWDIRYGRNFREDDETRVFKSTEEKCTGINFNQYDAIPVELTGRGSESIVPLTSFRDTANVHALLMENIVRVDYERPTPVQKYSIPVLLAGRDLMACAQTGSGKTAAFLFPIITSMLNAGPPPDLSIESMGRSMHHNVGFPVSLVLSPTRELTVQIYEESRKFSFNTGIRTVVVYGGQCNRSQVSDINRGCDIIVATPGRLQDHLSHGVVSLKQVRHFVLDEADRMLDMGFSPQIYEIVEEYDMPRSTEGRQTIMFSATFPSQIQRLASEFLKDYLFLSVGRVGSATEFVTQHLVYADEESKPKKLMALINDERGQLVIVFVETKKKADTVEDFLKHAGYAAVAIHGDKSQGERERALKVFRTGKCPILVATDVAARGLDISNISHVINCDLPSKLDDYVHRIGRTGRAGNKGKATSFVNERDRGLLRELLCNLESSNQDVPPWFYDMVRQVTSGRNFNNMNSSFGGRGGGGRGNRSFGGGGSAFGGSAFGGKDVRGGGGGGGPSYRDDPPMRNTNNDDFLRARNAHANDDDDGW